jgi:hypothetical protein
LIIFWILRRTGTTRHDESLNFERELVGKRPRFRAYRFGEVRQHRGVDRVRLRDGSRCLGEVAHLARVHDSHRDLRGR